MADPYMLVAEALQQAWDDFVGDTGCFPDCFEIHDGKRGTKLFAEFDRGNFHRFVTDWLIAKGVTFDRAQSDALLALAKRTIGPE